MVSNETRLKRSQEKAAIVRGLIEQACISAGLNLAIHEGKIAFVDLSLGKIVMVWSPEYAVPTPPGVRGS